MGTNNRLPPPNGMDLQRALALAVMALDEVYRQTNDMNWMKARVLVKDLKEREKDARMD